MCQIFISNFLKGQFREFFLLKTFIGKEIGIIVKYMTKDYFIDNQLGWAGSFLEEVLTSLKSF